MTRDSADELDIIDRDGTEAGTLVAAADGITLPGAGFEATPRQSVPAGTGDENRQQPAKIGRDVQGVM